MFTQLMALTGSTGSHTFYTSTFLESTADSGGVEDQIDGMAGGFKLKEKI